ncbi:hypothetical protein [Mucilaginibacter pedocola]|nr:hypothetical protein [Mucilaginibacter pedocola]
MATSTPKKGDNTQPAKAKELKTDHPLSEKDEVKKAEEKTNHPPAKKA